MQKFVFFSCAHFSLFPPLMRKEDYGSLVLGKLKGIFEYARAKGADVFCLGDLFHRKSGTTIREINSMLEVFGDDHKIYSILGNHDCQGYRSTLQSLETQPIGVLVKAGKIILPDSEGLFYNKDGVAITGANYHADYEALSTYNKKVVDCDFHIHLTHGMLTNSSLPYQATNVKDLSFSADFLINGHNHKFFKDEELGIYNVGSASRIAMDKNNLTKKPVFLYIEYPPLKVEVVEIPIKKDVWIKEVKRDTLDNEEVEKFAKSIQEMELSNDEEILKELLKDEKEEIREKVYSYLGE